VSTKSGQDQQFWRVPSAAQVTGLQFIAAVREDPLHRPAGTPGRSTNTLRRKGAVAAGERTGRMGTTPNELAASQAVICHTLPTPFRRPM
jgi:hypothetical protein